MSKDNYTFTDFLDSVNISHREFIEEVNNMMLKQGYITKVELKKTGYAVSYINKKTKKTIFNYVNRKKGLIVRVYGDNVDKYMNVIDAFPESMKKEIVKATDCKRLIDSTACNPKCKMGYTVVINGELHQKCRFSGFMFLLEQEKYIHIKTMIENEIKERA